MVKWSYFYVNKAEKLLAKQDVPSFDSPITGFTSSDLNVSYAHLIVDGQHSGNDEFVWILVTLSSSACSISSSPCIAALFSNSIFPLLNCEIDEFEIELQIQMG